MLAVLLLPIYEATLGKNPLYITSLLTWKQGGHKTVETRRSISVYFYGAIFSKSFNIVTVLLLSLPGLPCKRDQ